MNFLCLHCDLVQTVDCDLIQSAGIAVLEPLDFITGIHSHFNTKTGIDKNLHDFYLRPCGVTYSLDCGRFGDQLINYMKALCLSYMYDVTLFYKPFLYSDELQLSAFHLTLENYKSEFFKKKVKIKAQGSLGEFIEALEKPNFFGKKTLYSVSFLAPINEWEEEGFRSYLQKLVKPIKPIELLKMPKNNCISVAVHVRTGAGFDTQNNINEMPTKFPPYGFYVNGIKQIAEYYKDQSLYVYVFTDFPKPGEICNDFSRQLNSLNLSTQITMDFRGSENNFDLNVLEDFFSMMQFDCIIRPDSSYSRAAAIISGPIIEISPPSWGTFRTGNDGKVIVDSLVKVRSCKGGEIIDHFLAECLLPVPPSYYP